MDSSDEQSAFDGLQKITIYSFINFLSLQFDEFSQSEIKQKLSSVQKITCITGIVLLFCVFHNSREKS